MITEVAEIEEEKKEILRRYRKLLRHTKPLLQGDDAKMIKKAFNLSMEAHKNMRRKSGEPYIFHPLAVAQIVVDEIGLGPTSIICALLHDVVEDSDFELGDIEKSFGPKVARIIDGLTKISGAFDMGTSQQAENFRKMLLTLSEDVRVILIKIADRLHNMRTLASMPRNKQLKIASETSYIYAPLAHRLGLYAIKSELEDLYLKYSDSSSYREIATKINESKAQRTRFIRQFIKPLEDELKRQNFTFTIKGRPKSIYSIWNKMKKQNVPFEKVYDLFAIRIIVDTELEQEKSACWQVYSIVTDFYKPNPDRLRDWISTPKSNGYESLHTTVMSHAGKWVEVQIRTKRMDEIAEKGYAAHWKYKNITSSSRESGLEQWIAHVRDALEQNEGNAIEFVDDFRANLFNEEVFVFTPKGDLKILPLGASALDFAFEIHTDIGTHCIGAKVNQKLVPISYQLKNGDQVEILTSNKQMPNEDWLRISVTSKAKSKIKEALKEKKKLVAVDGKEYLIRKCKQYKLEPGNELVEQLRAFFDQKSHTELFYRIAKGKISPAQLKEFFEIKTNKHRKTDSRSTQKRIKRKSEKPEPVPPKKDVLLIGDDMQPLDYTIAKCCNPIPGDDVFGFVSVNEGIKIHRTSCPNAIELMSNYGYRVVKAKWTSQKEVAFLASLKIIGTDRVGLIKDVTSVISSKLKVNMRSISVDTESGIFEGTIMLYVNDVSHLTDLIKKLEEVDGIVEVKRFD